MGTLEDRLGDLAWVLDVDVPLRHAELGDVLQRVVARLERTERAPGTAGSAQRTHHIGSPAWSAPEEIVDGQPPDARTDVWALGLIGLRLLTGQPFWASLPYDFHALALEVTASPIPRPSNRHAELQCFAWSASIDEWFAHCVSRDRDERFASASVAATRLAEVLGASAGAPRSQRRSKRVGATLAFAGGFAVAVSLMVVVFFVGFAFGARRSPSSASAPIPTEPSATSEEENAPPPAPAVPLPPRAENDSSSDRGAPVGAEEVRHEVLDPWAAPESPPPSAARRSRHQEFADPWAELDRQERP